MPTLMQLFTSGYEAGNRMTREAYARGAAQDEFGAAADDPAMFQVLQQTRSMQQNQARQDARLDMDRERAAQQRTAAGMGMQRQQGQDRRADALRVVNFMRSARDRGEDLSSAFDRAAPMLEQIGVDSSDFDAMRQAVVDNPAILDDYYQSLTGTASTTAPTTTQTAEPAAPALTPEERQQAENETLKLQDVFRRIDLLADPERERAARSVFGAPGLRKLGQGGTGAGPALWGSNAADYIQDLEALQADLRSIAFETLKGGGQITQVESEFARDAISRLNRTMSYDQYQRELMMVRDYMDRLIDAVRRRTAGEDVPEIKLPSYVADTPETAREAGGMTGNASVPENEQVEGVGTFQGGNPTDPGSYGIKAGTFVEGIGTFRGGDPTDLDNWTL